ncbi:MAG: hypothetical protein COB20_11525 [SAR86 cluster bacterium]|uniref:Uncharacterized protein n=1 Tax=SAR86 cluster bacterium TaxID=2030880 RepID=A0A2A4X1R3_9GAMM|nr:MAG: hypothetical protein COB20_11525 [SAR86 cluster bacterium]
MNKLVLTLVIFFSISATAREKEVWSCQGTNSTGFSWSADELIEQEFYAENYLLTVDGMNSILRVNGTDEPMECRTVGSFHRCSSFTNLVVLKLTTGRGAYSTVSGVIQKGDGADSIVATVLQCSKF